MVKECSSKHSRAVSGNCETTMVPADASEALTPFECRIQSFCLPLFEEWSAFFICGNCVESRWVSGITIQLFVLFSPTRVFSTTSAFLLDKPPGFQRTIHLPRSSMSSGSESDSLWLGSPLLLCSESIDFSDPEAGQGFEANG